MITVVSKKAPKEGLLSANNLKRIQIKNLRWLHKLTFQFPTSKKVRIVLQFKVKDRITGKRKSIWAARTCLINSVKRNKDIYSRVRSLAKFFVCHEIDESIYFDNKRIYDPHKKK